MPSGFLSDPEARRAYILTKAGILAAVFLLTWPLSRWLGNRAWLGFAAFAVLLTGSTLLVLAMSRGSSSRAAAPDPGEAPGEDPAGALPVEPVLLPVEDAIDLHAFQPADIPDVVRDYLEAAWQAGFREVRLIHGRGIGVQRERVRSVLSSHPLVLELHDAPADRGGWGATIARLRETPLEPR